MSDLTFEQRHRLEAEVLPAVVNDPEYAAATIVLYEAETTRLKALLVRARPVIEDCISPPSLTQYHVLKVLLADIDDALGHAVPDA